MATVLDKMTEFRNEPIKDFTDSGSRSALEAAIAAERARFGTVYDLVIGGKPQTSPKQFPSRNPSKPSEIIGLAQSATPEQARDAIDAARVAFGRWSKTPPAERAAVLFRAADAVRKRRYEFDALLVLEVGKSWIEADGDV